MPLHRFLGELSNMLPRYLLVLSLIAAASPTAASGQGSRAAATPNRQVEEIYVSRAVRDSRTTSPTAFCDETRIGFGRTLFEDRFTFRSIESRPADGLVVNTDVQTIGNMRVCFGATGDAATLNFHAEGTLAAVSFTGNGECLTVKRDFPESGLTVMRCYLELGNLPGGYVGGQLTTNTVLSRSVVGPVSDPEGYTQPSIVTIRLWKRG
jgi:hypothetical protein